MNYRDFACTSTNADFDFQECEAGEFHIKTVEKMINGQYVKTDM